MKLKKKTGKNETTTFFNECSVRVKIKRKKDKIRDYFRSKVTMNDSLMLYVEGDLVPAIIFGKYITCG